MVRIKQNNPDSWLFSPLEFTVLWAVLGRDVLPGPLRYQPTVATQDEYRRDIDRAGMAVAEQLSDNLYSALTAMTLPDVRVDVYGYVGMCTQRPIGIHAVLRERVGVVAVQAADGVVYLDRMGATRVCAQVIRALPRCGAGMGGTFRARFDTARPASDVEPQVPTSLLGDVVAPPPPGKQLRGFLARPRSGFGHFVVNPGPAVDKRPTDGGLDCYFADYPDDGRYLVRRNAVSMDVDPIDDASLTTYLQRSVDTVQQGDKSG